jgi:hypothetical protein
MKQFTWYTVYCFPVHEPQKEIEAASGGGPGDRQSKVCEEEVIIGT